MNIFLILHPTGLLYKFFINILSQTCNATLFLFDYFYVHAHVQSQLFHPIKSSFSQASNHILVLTICPKLAKKQCIVSIKGKKEQKKEEMHGNVRVFDM